MEEKKEDKMAWVPELPGWVTLPRAAGQLNVSRQYIFQLAEAHQLTSLHRASGSGDRPAAYFISVEERDRMLDAQEREHARADSAAAEKSESAAV